MVLERHFFDDLLGALEAEQVTLMETTISSVVLFPFMPKLIFKLGVQTLRIPFKLLKASSLEFFPDKVSLLLDVETCFFSLTRASPYFCLQLE